MLVVHLRVVVSYGNRSLIQLYRRSESVWACFGGWFGAVISRRLKDRRSVCCPLWRFSQQTSAEIRRQYQTALERQRGELEAKLTAALGTVSNRLTPETLSRLGPDGLNNLVTQALHQAEVTAGTRAGVPTTVGGPRVTTVTDGDTSSSSSARMSHDSNLF